MIDVIFEQVFKASGYLLIAGFVVFAYITASSNSEGGKYKNVLWKGFLWCAGIAIFTSITLGNSSCIDSEYDLHGTVCNEYADDGYEATTDERVGNFIFILTLFYVPVVIAAIKQKND